MRDYFSQPDSWIVIALSLANVILFVMYVRLFIVDRKNRRDERKKP